MQDTLTRRGNINRRGTKEAVDEAIKMAAIKPFLDLSGDLSEYRLQARLCLSCSARTTKVGVSFAGLA